MHRHLNEKSVWWVTSPTYVALLALPGWDYQIYTYYNKDVSRFKSSLLVRFSK
jgi:hypothetical protein